MAVIIPNIPIVNLGTLYVHGLGISPGALNGDNLTTATVTIAGGACRDNFDVSDMVLAASVSVNSALSGQVNGLDQGAVAIDTLYAVYLIADSRGYSPTGGLLSTNFAAPLLPGGYDSFRRVGCVLTAHAAARFKWFDQRSAVNSTARDMWYATNVLCLNAGASATLASFNLSAVGAGTAPQVPITALKAYLLAALTADAGGTRLAIFAPQNTITIANGGAIAADPGTGEVIMSSPASTVTTASLLVPTSVNAGLVRTYYAVSNTSAALSVQVQGYIDQL